MRKLLKKVKKTLLLLMQKFWIAFKNYGQKMNIKLNNFLMNLIKLKMKMNQI